MVHDPVNHPTHYASEAKCSNCGETIEAIDVIRHLGFNIGNAMKYIWRAGKKDDIVQDLKKAVWYLQDQIAMLQGEKNPNVHRLSKDEADITWEQTKEIYRGVLPDVSAEGVSMLPEDERPFRHPNGQEVACEYAFYQDPATGSIAKGYYFCKVHESRTNRHTSEGANRPCNYIDPTGAAGADTHVVSPPGTSAQ